MVEGRAYSIGKAELVVKESVATAPECCAWARAGSTISHSAPPAIASMAAKTNAEFHPNRIAIYGVSDAVIAPPI